MVKLTGWKKHAAYVALFLVAFALALRQTFPADAVRERVVLEAAALGWQVKVVDVGPAGFLGARFTGVTLESRDGVRLPLDDAEASLRLRSLLFGRPGVDFAAHLFEGRVKGVFEEGRGARRLAATVSGIDLTKAGALRKMLGIDLGGTVEGDLDVTLDLREAAKSAGKLDLRVDKAALLGGQVQLASMGGGAFTLPRADLGAVVAQATVKDGKAVFDKLEAKSADFEMSGQGLTVTLQQRLAFSPVFGKARFKLQDGFWQKSGNPGLKSIADMALASARAQDGAFQFQIFGTLSSPQARPSPQ